MTFPTDIIVAVLQLLENNWVVANTGGHAPEFKTGWISPQGKPHQVCVASDPDETALGESGIYGFESGGGLHQMLKGLCFVECYAEAGNGLPDPMEVVYMFRREIQRIIMLNVKEVAGYDYVSYLGGNRIHPTHVGSQDHPTWIRYSCRIGYQWRNTPA